MIGADQLATQATVPGRHVRVVMGVHTEVIVTSTPPCSDQYRATVGERAPAMVGASRARIQQVNVVIAPLSAVVGAVLLRNVVSLARLVAGVAFIVVLVASRRPLRWAVGSRVSPGATAWMHDVLAGLAWGSFVWIMLPNAELPQVWLAIAIPFIMLTSVIELSGRRRSFYGFHLCFSTLSIAAYATSGIGVARWVAPAALCIAVYAVVLERITQMRERDSVALLGHNADLIDDLHRANAALERETCIDRLTGLPNRRALDRYLGQVFRERDARMPTNPLAPINPTDEVVALFIDLDGFKSVNDAHGHHVGDTLLTMAAKRIHRRLPAEGMVARFGGDEFVVVAPGQTLECARSIADRLVADLAAPFQLVTGTIEIGASIGVAISGDSCANPRELVHRADLGMYRAKETGRSRFVVYRGSGHRAVDHEGHAIPA